jgi:integrase
MLPRVDKVLYDEAAKDLRQHYQTTGSRDLDEAEGRLAHLDKFFAGRRLASLGGAEVTAYVAQRQAQGAANGTINRELGVFGRMLGLALEHNKLMRPLRIHKLKESAPRSGFFELDQYHAVRARLPEDLRVAVTIMHTFGWRKREVLALGRGQVDLNAGTLSLDPGSTKNDDGRIVYLTAELKAMLAAQLDRIDRLQKQRGAIIPFLFPILPGGNVPRHLVGRQRRDFRKVWKTACKGGGAPGRTRHDFRRTAVRNMERQGVPRSVAMKLTGHKTESVYRRYAIVNDADLREATRKLTGGAMAHEGR